MTGSHPVLLLGKSTYGGGISGDEGILGNPLTEELSLSLPVTKIIFHSQCFSLLCLKEIKNWLRIYAGSLGYE